MHKNIPNLLSAFRILLVPVFIFAYFSDGVGVDTDKVNVWAVGVYALASFTDFLDGMIARKFNLTSNLGKVLDPLGDKMMQVAVMICITIDGILPVVFVCIVIVKELLMGIGGVVIHRRAKVEIPPSNIVGKSATVLTIAVCIALLLFPAMPPLTANLIMGAALLLMFCALASYVITFSKVMRRKTSGAPDNFED